MMRLRMRVKLKRAGHILGSSYVEVALNDRVLGQKQRVVFSGGLGAHGSPLLTAPKSPSQADVLVLESTYEDVLHQHRRERTNTLRRAIERALDN